MHVIKMLELFELSFESVVTYAVSSIHISNRKEILQSLWSLWKPVPATACKAFRKPVYDRKGTSFTRSCAGFIVCAYTCISEVAHLECLAEREAFSCFGSLPLSKFATRTNPSALQSIHVL